jgi:outer membrane protein assembly factor BamB
MVEDIDLQCDRAFIKPALARPGKSYGIGGKGDSIYVRHLSQHKDKEVSMGRNKLIRIILTAVVVVTGLSAAVLIQKAGATTYPWLSWRHDLQNTGAAPDSGYPTAATVLWNKTRTPEPPLGTPARCTTPVVVGNDIVITTGNGGVVEARNQFTGDLLWTKTYLWIPRPEEPADTPPDWCQGSTPNLELNLGICAYKINGKCPDWCYECKDTPNDCNLTHADPVGLSLVSPLHFGTDWGVFVTAATIDLDPARIYFGTMDGRYVALNLGDGSEVWEKQPWREPGGPNEGRPWYDQKFAWHLSPPSVYDGKLYFGSFLPSFYWVFKAFPFLLDSSGHSVAGWPSFNKDYKMYWVGRDGWTYCADKDTGNILWGWDPGG